MKTLNNYLTFHSIILIFWIGATYLTIFFFLFSEHIEHPTFIIYISVLFLILFLTPFLSIITNILLYFYALRRNLSVALVDIGRRLNNLPYIHINSLALLTIQLYTILVIPHNYNENFVIDFA